MFPKGPSSSPARSKRKMHECLWKTRRFFFFFYYTMGFIQTPKTTKPWLHKSDHSAVSEVRDVICLDSYEMSGKKGGKKALLCVNLKENLSCSLLHQHRKLGFKSGDHAKFVWKQRENCCRKTRKVHPQVILKLCRAAEIDPGLCFHCLGTD